MTPDRVRQIAELYQTIRESPASQCAALLAQADPELRSEVESLLAHQNEILPTLDPLTVTAMESQARRRRHGRGFSRRRYPSPKSPRARPK